MRFRPVFVQALWIAGFLLPGPLSAQDRARNAGKIIEACVRAEGGSKRLSQQRAVEFQGTVTDAGSMAAGSFTMILERPNRLYREVTLGDDTRREAYNGKSAWRQDSAQDLVRLEAYMAGNFKLAGGLLASLKKASAFTFEQSKVNDEVWLPSYLEAHINARLLLLKGMEGNFIEHYSSYKKFRVESVTKNGTVKGD